MYSKVTYASLWKAMNGFSESMLDELPSRNTPPSLTAPAVEPLPHPAAANTATSARAASADTRRTRREMPGSFFGRSLMLRHLRSRATAALGVPTRPLAAGARQLASAKVLPISVYNGQFADLPIIVDLTGGG